MPPKVPNLALVRRANALERTSAQIATTQTVRDAGMSEAPEALEVLLVGVRFTDFSGGQFLCAGDRANYASRAGR